MTRLIDIARSAGVSEATVSRVLNGRAGVNEATRRSVLEVARRMGRDVGPVASGGGPLVGVLVPDLDNQVFTAWAERIEAELFERGASTLVALRARTVEREREILQRFLHSGAEAIIVVSGHHAQERGPLDHYREVTAAGVPLVLVNGVREDLEAAFLSTDDEHAVTSVLGHLRELGHERLGLAVGDEHTWPVREKLRVFESVTADWEGAPQPVAFTDFSYAGGYEAARDLVERGATAIICGSDVMAAGALEGVRSQGLSVPRDVSVVGYDDVFWASLTDPPLTTVRQAVGPIARAAVRNALGGGEDSRRPARTEVVFRPQLVVRGSTAAAPGGAASMEW
ncbi:LacI family DNA-binding transcriptional regulator [Brachybacterium aquaticum]|uniref:DNA-binding LacI/PurR family transcriptional regulator n=1 Tax=Brachybacterium aquaticum TaxID=1432564 RepID=A0A841A9A9_9MICO|nr:LacI family DNA-binding transcriptional regulator [Brachybacterium aquaticum]MBB5831809.1 DNA-binding LacI/PurR family transcriptional regulator [Brachybacterium aquaticum]